MLTGDAWRSADGAARVVSRTLPLFGTGPVVCLETGDALVRACHAQGLQATAARWAGLATLPRQPVVFVAADGLDHRHAADLRRLVSRDLFVLDGSPERMGAAHHQLLLDAGFCRHPRLLRLTSFEALESSDAYAIAPYRVLPEAAATYPPMWLARERDLHMDMLREHGRRADAHLARYALACDFVRPRDRVVDLACGMGYGSAILREGTRAASILGIDNSASAIAYATRIHGGASVAFRHGEAAAVSEQAPGTVDVVVSFETLEHLADPETFVEHVTRLLTPGGRFICSVPNRWVDDTGRDPNPHHLHVFDRARVTNLCAGGLRLERLFAQTAGGGMKHAGAARRLRDASDDGEDADPEWWLLVAMKDPVQADSASYREAFAPDTPHPPTVVSFASDYDNPWLVRSLVSRGVRATSPTLLRAIADDVIATAPKSSADRGAALCVRGYLDLDAAEGEPGLDAALEAYVNAPSVGNPHVERWRISNEFVLAQRHLRSGRTRQARVLFERCAQRQSLAFSPLLATKTVEAAFWAGWLALQQGDADSARRWWTEGLLEAHRAVSAPWDNALGSFDRPLLFGMRELADVLDTASSCASGLHVLDEFAARPGLAAEETLRTRRHETDRLQWELDATRHALEAATREIDRLRAQDDRRRALRRALDGPGGVVVFGAGEGGRLAVQLVERCGGRVLCLLDNRPDLTGARRHGYEVRAPEAIGAHGGALVVIGSSVDLHAIMAQLLALGVGAERITTRAELIASLGGSEADAHR